MAKYVIKLSDAKEQEIEADGVEIVADGQQYRFYKGSRTSGRSNTVLLISTELVRTVERIKD